MSTQENIIQTIPEVITKVKAPRKVPVKRKAKESQPDVVVIQEEPKVIVQEESKEVLEEVKEFVKRLVIVAFDPGFIRCGLAILDATDGSIIKTECIQLRPEKSKLTQSQVEAHVNANLQRIIGSLYNEYNIERVIVELQLGNFSCTPVQTAIVAHLRNDTPFVIQHSKLKLKHPERKDVDNKNKESNAYNQNKMIGRELAQFICKDFKETNYDQCDAVLHGLYAFRNKQSITFVTKDQILNP